MSVADLHDLELVWPSLGPRNVIVTGTFDQWSASIHLVRGDAGFSGTVKAPWGEKVAYKFIVDGHWRCREDQPQEDDGHGNTNNVLRTPEKPLALDPTPARLIIPVDPQGDVDNMVTAVEFLTPAETAPPRGALPPLPIPRITVEGLMPVSESKLNTAAATEGHGVFSASETPEKREPAPLEQATASWDVPTHDNGFVPLPSSDGSGEAYDPHSISTPAAIQSTQGELSTSSETAKEAISAASEPAVPEPSKSQQVARDAPAVTDRADVPLAPAPPSIPDPITKQPLLDHADTATRGPAAQVTSLAPVSQASTSSTPASSTVTHKKRRSLFARIKHIFDKDHDKQGKKEKHKH